MAAKMGTVVNGRAVWRIAELIKYVWIIERKVGDNEVRQKKPAEHRSMDDASGAFAIAANRLQSGTEIAGSIARS